MIHICWTYYSDFKSPQSVLSILLQLRTQVSALLTSGVKEAKEKNALAGIGNVNMAQLKAFAWMTYADVQMCLPGMHAHVFVSCSVIALQHKFMKHNAVLGHACSFTLEKQCIFSLFQSVTSSNWRLPHHRNFRDIQQWLQKLQLHCSRQPKP